MSGRPQVLFVSKRLPVPSADHAGGQITYRYLCSTAEYYQVDLVTLIEVDESAEGLPPARTVELVSSRLESTDAGSLTGMLTRLATYTRLLHHSIKKARHGSYDLLVLERSALGWMSVFLSSVGGGMPTVLVLHDLWFDRLKADAGRSQGWKRLYFNCLAAVAQRLELWAVRHADGIICFDIRTRGLVTQHNRALTEHRIIVLPPYFKQWKSKRPKRKGRVCFYGNMGRSVNWESALWFIENVIPCLATEASDLSFYVVGSNPPELLLGFDDNKRIVVTGYIESPDDVLMESEVFVAPLLSGTGIKIKVLEAMASGVPVVANAIAMQGIPAVVNRDYLHAESAEEFASQVLRLLRDSKLRERVASNAAAFLSSTMDFRGASHRQRQFLAEIIEENAPSVASRHGHTPGRRRVLD